MMDDTPWLNDDELLEHYGGIADEEYREYIKELRMAEYWTIHVAAEMGGEEWTLVTGRTDTRFTAYCDQLRVLRVQFYVTYGEVRASPAVDEHTSTEFLERRIKEAGRTRQDPAE